MLVLYSMSSRQTEFAQTCSTPMRRSLVMPSQVPPLLLPASLPERTQPTPDPSVIPGPTAALRGSNLCHAAGIAGRSRYSSRLDINILRDPSAVAEREELEAADSWYPG